MKLKRHIKNWGIILMSVLILTGICSMKTLAEQGNTKNIESYATLSEIQTITGFDDFDINENALHLIVEYKPSLEEVVQMMPKKLKVFLDENAKTEELEVEWYCITQDYETSNEFYFQFSPKWDTEKYVLSEKINLLIDAPYIGVFFTTDSQSISTYSVTGNSNETTVYRYLTETLGYNVAAACGALANIQCESSFVPNNLENAYESKLGYTDASYTSAVDSGAYTNFVRDAAGYGLCQWTYYTRKQGLYDLAKSWGVSIGNLSMQLEYLKRELTGSSTGNYMKSSANTADGAYNVGYYYCSVFENPAQTGDAKSVARGNLARNTYWPEYSGIIDDTIRISGQTVPGTISVGNVFSISGTVSSGASLTNVTAGVYDVNGNMKTGKSASPNATSYNLKGLDPYVYFNHLEAGVYYYRVTASNSSGTSTLVDQPFIVLENNRTVPDGTYVLASVGNNDCVVDVAGHTNANEANVELADATGSAYQNFEVTYVGNGYYTLLNSGSGKMLDVHNGLSTSGTNVKQYEQNGGTAQNWQILPTGDGYCLVPQCATTCVLDVADGVIGAGINIRIWSANLTVAQRFQLLEGGVQDVTISFNANGGSGAPAAQTVTVGSNITIPSVIPTRFGWNFKGWGTSATATSVSYQPGTSYRAENAFTLYAVWEQCEALIKSENQYNTNIIYPGKGIYYKIVPSVSAPYKIRSTGEYDTRAYLYDANGVLLTEDDDNGDVRNFEISYVLEKGKTYYAYVGFYSNTTVENFDTKMYRGFKVNYNTNGGKETFASEYYYAYYRDYALGEWSKVTTPSRAGYTFVEWNTAKDGSGNSWNLNNLGAGWMAYLLQKGEATLYAIWEKVQVEDGYVNPFIDVSDSAWYTTAVRYVHENGIMSGNNGLFNPTGNITRAQLVTTLYRLAGSPKVLNKQALTDFTDVAEGKYYTDAVCWAYATGVGTGNGDKFNPTGQLTRQQLAAFFYRFAEYQGVDITVRSDISKMVGADKVSGYAKDAVEWAVGAGLISGSKTTNANGETVYDLKPRDNTTRAQVAVILQRFCENNGL